MEHCVCWKGDEINALKERCEVLELGLMKALKQIETIDQWCGEQQ